MVGGCPGRIGRWTTGQDLYLDQGKLEIYIFEKTLFIM